MPGDGQAGRPAGEARTHGKMYMFSLSYDYLSRVRLVHHEFGPCRHREEARDKAAGWAPGWAPGWDPGPWRLGFGGSEMLFGWLPDVVEEVRLLGIPGLEGCQR